MVCCAVKTCMNHYRKTRNSGIKYFRFPKNPKFVELWIAACGRDRETKLNLKHATVCSIHFHADCMEIPLKMKLLNYQPETARLLKDDAVPTLHLQSPEVSEADINMDTSKPTCDASTQIPDTISEAEEKLPPLQEKNIESDMISASTELVDPLAIDETQLRPTTEKDPLHEQTQTLSWQPDTFIPLDSDSLVVPKILKEDDISPNVAKDNFEQFGRFVASQLRKASPERAAKLQGKIFRLLLGSDANS